MRARILFLVLSTMLLGTLTLTNEARATGGGTHCHHNSCNTGSGENGENGQNGLNGQNGANGVNGQNGLNGQNGGNGENGRDGRDGRDGRVTEIPAMTAYAAPVIATEDTCMGSSSVGAQGMAFGVSVGTTWRDENCQRLKNSRELAAHGYDLAAVALLCVDDDVRDAMSTAGTPCPGQAGQVASERSAFSFFGR